VTEFLDQIYKILDFFRSVPGVKQFFQMRRPAQATPRLWPTVPKDFESVMMAYSKSLADFAREILRSLSIGLRMDDTEWLPSQLCDASTMWRLFRYNATDQLQLGDHAQVFSSPSPEHTDLGLVTVVCVGTALPCL